MKKFSCETHIDHALDMFVAEYEDFPIMDKLSNDEKLSTKCDYCEEQAAYIVSRK
ncbi:CxxH/CxxC protein [Metasolibacillus meyeri]|uniref:CxxH/CxxC protein n=1 Tax=Metasolibacillus meyeri TaxID=1071052 RepID=A0AAW9NPL9_9BACL|nr:CxxH/CxxC protein [Metasolibacillus meyeri]MEC1178446.1 CxxH/CxxC protein [Metasolibacillus meyeri]